MELEVLLRELFFKLLFILGEVFLRLNFIIIPRLTTKSDFVLLYPNKNTFFELAFEISFLNIYQSF